MTTVGTVSPAPISNREFRGVGVQADRVIYDDINRKFGVDEEDHALFDRRLRALRPGWQRLRVHTTRPKGTAAIDRVQLLLRPLGGG